MATEEMVEQFPARAEKADTPTCGNGGGSAGKWDGIYARQTDDIADNSESCICTRTRRP